MSLSATTIPNAHMAAYSAIPLRIKDNNFNNFEDFKYIINIIYDKVGVLSSSPYGTQPVAIINNVYTRLFTATPHNFNVGDVVLLNDSLNVNKYSGYYNVQKVLSTTSIVIDLEYDIPFINNASISRVIKYTMPPDIDGEAKLNLSNTIKNFVTQNLEDSNDIFNGDDTAFNYELLCGAEYVYVYEFDKFKNVGGTMSFISSGLTSTSGVTFQIGDTIQVNQDLYEWTYTDNFFSANNVGFTGGTHYYGMGSSLNYTVTITGQETHPSYNGPTSVYSVALDTTIVTDKTWLGSTPVEGGKIYGVPFPEYNVSATITNITYSAGTGVIISTNLPSNGLTTSDTILIGGEVRLSNDRKSVIINDLSVTGLTAYNARINNFDYSVTAFDKYVNQARSLSSNYISTILINNQATPHIVERNTKGYLLSHVDRDDTTITGAKFGWYNTSGTYLGWSTLSGGSGLDDFYIPYGFNQITASTNRTDFCTFSAVTNTIGKYTVEVTNNNLERSNPIWFKLNDDCSSYDIYHIMFKDALGSFISIPFKYISRDNIEAERKSYYQSEGNWNNNTFGYDDYGRGEKQYYGRSRKSVIVNSGWLKDYEVPMIEDMFESPSLYLQLPDGTLVGGRINSNKIELYKTANNDMIQYQFEFIYSSNNYRL